MVKVKLQRITNRETSSQTTSSTVQEDPDNSEDIISRGPTVRETSMNTQRVYDRDGGDFYISY